MTNGFLNVSRLESGKMHIEKSTFDLCTLFKESWEEYRLLYPNNTITVKLSDEKVCVCADRDKIAQVFNNLVGNAVKYSPVGSDISVTIEQYGAHARVIVSDNGIGIKQEDLTKLFERYYRVGNTTISGFGIGLYLSMEIIERHGGKIWAESELGRGSKFYFELAVHDS
ncbi:Sensor histidine kinase YycG [compost metagenome]